jgi:hypothetical protein
MIDVFLFGTLCWPELLRLVGGTSCPVGVDAVITWLPCQQGQGASVPSNPSQGWLSGAGNFAAGDVTRKFWRVWITMKAASATGCTR